MAKLVILTLDLIEARALLALVQQPKEPEQNQYRGATRAAINKLEKAVLRAANKEPVPSTM